MTDNELKMLFMGMDLSEFVREQHAQGRAKLTKQFKAYWSNMHILAREVARDSRHTPYVRRIAQLLKEITYSIAILNSNPVPTYYPYTDVHLLDWYIGRRREEFAHFKLKSAEGIFALFSDLLRYENASVSGVESNHRESFNTKMVAERIKLLRETIAACSTFLESMSVDRHSPQFKPVMYEKLSEYALETSRLSGLVHLSCMPQTRFHDEVVFLRAIHISEFCFFGIRMVLMETIENIDRGHHSVAESCLNQAIQFAKMLYRSFKILRTMPPEHFMEFREATGHASAVQSRNYQLMDVYLRGVNPMKQEVFGRVHALSDLSHFRHPLFLDLGRALKRQNERDAMWNPVFCKARLLDRHLLTWRGLHLGFAKTYLPQEQTGTGGTSGASYLQKFLRAGLFEQTSVDLEVVDEMFSSAPEVRSIFRVPSHIGIAPLDQRS